MGAVFNDTMGGFIYCEAAKIRGCDIQLDYPSVGATENIMLASAMAEGVTYIRNAAKEPEIVDLQDFLQKMGIKVSGAGSAMVRVEGCKTPLNAVEKTVIPDRIVTGTYMTAAAITGGRLVLKNTIPEHTRAISHVLRECGCEIKEYKHNITITGPLRPNSIDIIRTLPFPGFPTDMQSQIVALLTLAKGTSIIVETVFENRYRHVDELIRMGADITIEGRIAVIKGVEKLIGANVRARDLRGGAGLVLAGLAAEGTTVVDNITHIDRGYERFDKDLNLAGADITRAE
jgi:UDP-N-acetylglucosamine 1-carboxyvinyltransferase